MKTLFNILLIEVLMLLVSCGQPNEKKIVVNSSDSLQLEVDKKVKARLEKRKEIEEQEYADSLRLDKVLQDALKIANQNFNKEKFILKYEVLPDSIPVSVEISLDYHFTKANPHLIIRRNEQTTFYIDIYSKGDNQFENVASHEEWELTYMRDTIKDVNGDGLRDFVVDWYGSSGCCLKAFSDVYLLRQNKKSFTDSFEFVNPTFSPKEKVVRGVCYGHPSETAMYKYKWDGESVDTLEYVSYERKENGKTGKVLITTNEPYLESSKTIKVLNSVPLEYTKIHGYDWFTGNPGE